MKKNQIYYLVFSIIVILVIAFYFKKYRVAPAIELYGIQIENLEEQSFDWNSTKGRPIFIQFFATWCGECRAELPIITTLMDSLSDSNFQYLLISDESLETLNLFKNRSNPKLTIYHSKTPLKQVNIFTFPTTYILNKSGHVVYKVTGAQNWCEPKTIELIKKKINKF